MYIGNFQRIGEIWSRRNRQLPYYLLSIKYVSIVSTKRYYVYLIKRVPKRLSTTFGIPKHMFLHTVTNGDQLFNFEVPRTLKESIYNRLYFHYIYVLFHIKNFIIHKIKYKYSESGPFLRLWKTHLYYNTHVRRNMEIRSSL